jgi:hypothetical protein
MSRILEVGFLLLMAFTCLFIALLKIPHLLREIRFYWSRSFDLKADSGENILQQDELVKRFKILPLGAVKLLSLIALQWTLLIISLPLIYYSFLKFILGFTHG